MVHDLSSQRTGATSTRARLDRHFARALDCDAALLRRPGVTVVPTPVRQAPEWQGWILPVYAVAPVGATACVVSCVPEVARSVRDVLSALPPNIQALDQLWLAAMRGACSGLVDGDWSASAIYVADASAFRPYGIDHSIRVERLDTERYADTWLARAFDGPCYVIRSGGTIASWAGTKQKSDDAWEIAAVTEPAFRGRGLATLLTAMATEDILRAGRLALWVADRDNAASRRLVERLGYQLYGETVTLSRCDVSDEPAPPRGSP